MKLATFSFVLLAAAACHGKSKSTTGPGNTGGGASKGGVPAPWTEVFVEGATFTLDNNMDGVTEEPMVVIATVTKVTRDDKGAAADLAWKDPDGQEVSGGLPTHVRVDGDLVTFGEGESAAHFPAPTADSAEQDYYAHLDGDTVCYGEGPAPDAGDCEDVCFAELCVTAGRGIVSGAGTWWPNYEVFQQVAPK